MTVHPDIISFGCRLNIAEAEGIRAAASGDTVVINSCAVTAEAVRQTRQAIRRAARARPTAAIIVTGCAAQIAPADFAAMPEVTRVLGNREKFDAAHYPLPGGERATQPQAERGEGEPTQYPLAPLGAVESPSPQPGEGKTRVADIFAPAPAGLAASSYTTHTRGFVEVQTGCDHRCTFCVIPYGRGNARSAPAGAVIDRIKALVDSGISEIVLTGVDLTSYGPDLPGQPTLGSLVQRILRHVPDLPRLRLSSIDSIEVDPALFDAVTGDKRVMPHLHLSLQAGDDMILKRMKRRHSRGDAIDFCARVRAARPDIAFGADLIAGFPTETEAMFTNTLALVDDCGLSQLHVFAYSQRAGTPAARMPQLPVELRRDRAARLRAVGDARRAAWLAAQVGRPQRILVEASGRTGHAENFAPARLDRAFARGAIVHAVARGVTDGQLECTAA